MIRTGRLNARNLGMFTVRELTADKRSSFRRKKAGRVLGVASNCSYSSGRKRRLTSASRMKLPTCHQYVRRKSQLPNIRATGRVTFLTIGVEKSQIAAGRRSDCISQ